MSTVYDAWDSDIARRVAVKLMPLSSIDDGEAGEAFTRFKRGAQAAGQLNHPNIVGIYDYGETDDYAYLVMEFVNGPTLKAIFDENRRFSLPDICRIIGSVLDALQYSHEHGVVHRDVKPANIMLTTANQVKITDFGIARLEDSEMTQAGMVIGTPAYMSPEQFLGEKIDWRTDIYSTGVVLYHLLTGERPYEGNLATIMHKVLYGSALSPSHVSTLVTPALDEVVTRAMARDPEARFRSATEFNTALQAALRAPRVTAGHGLPPASVRPPGSKLARSGSRTVVLVALAISLIGAAGGAAWFGLFRPAPLPPHSQVPPPQDQQAIRQQEEARIQQEQQARLQQEQQARIQQEQQARIQQEQQEQQARIQRDEQARIQQEQQARLQREELARQQEQQARIQRDEQARIQQEQQARIAREELARQQQELQNRLQQQQDQARQAARDQARQKPPPDQKLAQDQNRQRPMQEQLHAKPEPPAPPPANTLPNMYPVTSISSAAGLVCESITADTAAGFGLDSPQGMVVKGVLVGGPASAAGIREQDVILKIKGTEAHDLSALNKLAADSPGGQVVPVDILRHGTHKLVELRLK